jgi:hypothetical protein
MATHQLRQGCFVALLISFHERLVRRFHGGFFTVLSLDTTRYPVRLTREEQKKAQGQGEEQWPRAFFSRLEPGKHGIHTPLLGQWLEEHSMPTERGVAYYISAHGYGHGVHSCDILRGVWRRWPA